MFTSSKLFARRLPEWRPTNPDDWNRSWTVHGRSFRRKMPSHVFKILKKDKFSIQKVPRVSNDPKTAVFGTLLPDKRSPLSLSKLVWTKHSTHTTAMQCAKRSSRWSRLDHVWTFFVPFFCESVAIFARGGLWTVAWVCWGSSSLMEDFSVFFFVF